MSGFRRQNLDFSFTGEYIVILGDGEWVMNNQNIAIDEYEILPSFFNPIDFDAEAWVTMAKEAGMKYITITSRHHDGFSMFDSKLPITIL